MGSILELLKEDVLKEELKQLFQEAYELGIEDSRKQHELPFLLTKKDLAKLFQVKESTVNKIVGIRGFPKSTFIAARYPRDEVFQWMKENSINNLL